MFELTVPDLYSYSIHMCPNEVFPCRTILLYIMYGFHTVSKFLILHTAVADLRGGVRDARPPPPLGVQILSISCSFWENSAKLCVHAPPPWRVHAPPSVKSWIRHCTVSKFLILHILTSYYSIVTIWGFISGYCHKHF